MQNWNIDVWKESDWRTVELYSRDFRRIATNIENAIGGGGGGFSPQDLLAMLEDAEIITERLREIAQSYT